QPVDQLVDASCLVTKLGYINRRRQRDIQRCLRYVDPRHLLVHRASSRPILATMRARALAQPFGLTKRSGGATLLNNGLEALGGKRGRPRRRKGGNVT